MNEKIINKYIEYVKLRNNYRLVNAKKSNYYYDRAYEKIQKIKKDNENTRIIEQLLENSDVGVRLFTASNCLDVKNVEKKSILVLKEIASTKYGFEEFYDIDAKMILNIYMEEHSLANNKKYI